MEHRAGRRAQDETSGNDWGRIREEPVTFSLYFRRCLFQRAVEQADRSAPSGIINYAAIFTHFQFNSLTLNEFRTSVYE